MYNFSFPIIISNVQFNHYTRSIIIIYIIIIYNNNYIKQIIISIIYTTCQGKGKFGKLGGEKSCIVVYGSARSSECEAHGPSATATINFEYYII